MTWYQVDTETKQVETDHLLYRYGSGYLHNGDGVSIIEFIDKRTMQNTAYGFDGQYKGQAWDDTPVQILKVVESAETLDLHIQTGQTTKIDRIYRDRPVLEIIYEENHADWTEDFVRAYGEAEHVAFIMHGLPDIAGLAQGKALWDAAEMACGHNYGECFLQAAGGSVATCQIDAHFVYGYVNRRTGYGTGFVYPTWITTREWKVWWTETHKIEIEYAPHENTGRRVIFPITNGREEMMATARWWLAKNSNPEKRH